MLIELISKNWLWRAEVNILFGLGLKFLAIISKVFFLFLIVPELPSGVFSTYLVFITVIVLLSRILSLGFDEHLPPLLVRKKWKSKQVGDLALLALAASFIFLVASFEIDVLSIISLFFMLTTTFLLAGIVRSVNNIYYEILSTIPWVLFLIISLLIKNTNIYSLFLSLSISYMVVISSLFIWLRKRIIAYDFNVLYLTQVISKEFSSSVLKLSSSLLLMLNLRSFSLAAFFFYDDVTADKVAVISSAAEAGYQFLNVFVNRGYTSLLKREWSIKGVVRLYAIIVFLGFVGGGGSYLIEVFRINIGNLNIEWEWMKYYTIFIVYLVLVNLVKYIYWSRCEEWRLLYAHQIFSILVVLLMFYFSSQILLIYMYVAGFSSLAIIFMYILNVRWIGKLDR